MLTECITYFAHVYIEEDGCDRNKNNTSSTKKWNCGHPARDNRRNPETKIIEKSAGEDDINITDEFSSVSVILVIHF